MLVVHHAHQHVRRVLLVSVEHHLDIGSHGEVPALEAVFPGAYVPPQRPPAGNAEEAEERANDGVVAKAKAHLDPAVRQVGIRKLDHIVCQLPGSGGDESAGIRIVQEHEHRVNVGVFPALEALCGGEVAGKVGLEIKALDVVGNLGQFPEKVGGLAAFFYGIHILEEAEEKSVCVQPDLRRSLCIAATEVFVAEKGIEFLGICILVLVHGLQGSDIEFAVVCAVTDGNPGPQLTDLVAERHHRYDGARRNGGTRIYGSVFLEKGRIGLDHASGKLPVLFLSLDGKVSVMVLKKGINGHVVVV